MANPHAGIAAWNFKLVAEIHSYEDCRAFVGDTGERSLGPQMVVYDRLNASGVCGYAVKLYDTEIIRYYPDGSFSVDNGGHNTPTTMYRLQAVLPAGWTVNHYRKQLALRGPGGRWLQHWPCTHELRLRP